MLRRYGKFVLVSERSLDRTEAFFRRHGEISTFVGRLLPVIRHLISIPAGMSRMALGRFVAFTALGAGLWCGILTYLGWLIGRHGGRWSGPSARTCISTLLYYVCPATVVLVGGYVWWRRRGARPDDRAVPRSGAGAGRGLPLVRGPARARPRPRRATPATSPTAGSRWSPAATRPAWRGWKQLLRGGPANAQVTGVERADSGRRPARPDQELRHPMTIVTPLARHVLRHAPADPELSRSQGSSSRTSRPVLRDGRLFRAVVEAMAEPFREPEVTHVVGIEARGFILGGAVATSLGAGFVPARKPGKLPWERVTEAYDLEYGKDALECHRDGLPAPARVLIVDDVLATGGTARAAGQLARGLGAELVGWSFLLEIAGLGGQRG